MGSISNCRPSSNPTTDYRLNNINLYSISLHNLTGMFHRTDFTDSRYKKEHVTNIIRLLSFCISNLRCKCEAMVVFCVYKAEKQNSLKFLLFKEYASPTVSQTGPSKLLTGLLNCKIIRIGF